MLTILSTESNQVAEELGVRNAHSVSMDFFIDIFRELKKLTYHFFKGPVYALLVLPNGAILSGGGGESTVRAWSRGPKLVPTNVELKVNTP